MELVTLDITNKVATVTLNNGKVNAISHQVIAELNQALDQAEAAKAVVILTGKQGILSGGFDLKTMQTSMTAAMALVTEGSKLTRRLLSSPSPIIAACPGHAVAKGAFLLLSCDYRIGIEGPYKIGLNEVAIGMTMHHAGIEMARERIPKNYLHRALFNAEMFDPATAMQAGFLDKVVAADQLMAEAEQVAEYFKTLNLRAHHATRLKARQAYLELLDKAIELDAKGSL